VPVPVFCCFCVSEKLHRKYSQNWTKRKPKFLFTWCEDGVQRRDEEALGGGRTIGRHSLTLAAPLGGVGPWSTSRHRPSTYKFSSSRKTKRTKHFSTKHTASRHRHLPEIGRVQKLFLTPYRRGESSPKAFFVTMPASGVMCLDHGSIAVATWLYSPPCASCLDLVSFLSWSRSLMLAVRLMWITVQLGTPRGRYDEYRSKVFPQ
jgi:hypothetical protein